ncbi:MAG: hypothetical protein DHS20C13_29570 [Thermodesulfobacteriota bacterium]|nr:MAG: hypothetical protein DHS20C13_29570 [Thermodesulfobacteriota bacterium]
MPEELRPKLINLRQLSIYSNIPLSTLRRWASERRFPLYKISSRVMVQIDEFDNWLEEYKINPYEGGL